jgi:nitrite reductase (NO-forming)
MQHFLRQRRLSGMIMLVLILALAACTQLATPAPAPTAQSNPLAAQPAPTVAPVIRVVEPTGPVLDTLHFTGIDMGFTPETAEIAAPGRYTIVFENKGSVLHDITFTDGTKISAKPGETQQSDVMIDEAGVKFICSLPGHKESGMVGTISVAGHTGAMDEGGDHGGPPPALDIQPDPKAPAFALYDPVAPARLEGEVHDIELVTKEMPMTVAEGFVQQVWTFNGTVPGPVIRVKVGDTIRIHLKNPADSQLPHSVDFHSSMVAWNDEMTSISPGEEKLYEWKAEYAGVWMYHCGTAPALHHIANGMYGMVIVEPQEGLPPVDKEFVLVQSEWYLGPQGQPSSLTKASAPAPSPDFVVFNGVANQYAKTPITIGTGERVRVFVLNAGPSMDSSFHIVGTIFDTVIKEGVFLARGNPGNYGAQAVDLAPAQGAIVEFSMAEDGLYPIVTHAFNLVGRGALGLFQAGDGDPK